MGNWYSKGAETHETARREKAEREKNKGNANFDPRSIFRHYMREGAEAKLVMILDDEPLNTHMHNFEKDGRWGNWITCPKKTGADTRCPLCERKNYPRLVGNYTMLDITGWEGKDGHRMGIKILPAPSELVAKLDRKRKRKGTLIGAIFEVRRDGKVSVGDDWELVESVNPAEYLEENFDAIWKSLSYYPEEWGFWEWKEGMKPAEGEDVTDEMRRDNRNYFLKGLPFMHFLAPLDYEGTALFVSGGDAGDDSFNFGANASDDDDAGVDNDVMY